MEGAYLDIKKGMVSVVVPVFNGQNTLLELFQKIKNTFDIKNIPFQVIFVDDFSLDDSWNIVKGLKKNFPNHVLAIRLSKNFGQHNATLCGLKYVQGEWVVTIDDDLEYNPNDILNLLETQKVTGCDLVYGVDVRKGNSWVKRIFRNIYKKLAKLLEGDEKVGGSSFRLMKASLAHEISKNARMFSFIDEFVLWYTSKVSTVYVKCDKVDKKKSRYSFFNLSLLTKDLVLFNSVTPLRLVSLIGVMMSGFNLIWGGVVLYKKFVLSMIVEGYTSIIVAILFSSGLIILSIGIMAEYISKIIKLNYNKPPYHEAEVL